MKSPYRATYRTVLKCLIFLALGLVAEHLAPHALAAQSGPQGRDAEAVTYQGVVIRPGDVINFTGGGVSKATLNYLVYGHSALYLGIAIPKVVSGSFSTSRPARPDYLIRPSGSLRENRRCSLEGFSPRPTSCGQTRCSTRRLTSTACATLQP